MNCCDFDEYIDECFSGKAATFKAVQMLKHIESCNACAERMRIHKEYKQRMASLRAPNMHAVRTAKMIRSAVETAQRNELKPIKKPSYLSFVSGFAAALVLSVGFMYGSSLFSPSSMPLAEYASGFTAKEFNATRDITIVINAPSDMQGAELVFDLPADISISGQEHLASLTLPVNLKKGANVIVLPVDLEPFAEYSENLVMMASLIYKNSKKDFELDINLESSQKEKHETQNVDALKLNTYS